MAPEWQGVTLARIVRARGRKGEVAAEILTDFPERLPRLKEVWLWNPAAGVPRRVSVRACWLHKDRAIFHFAGIDSISEAETLHGLEVQVPLSERVALPQGKYYVTDLVGCEVWESGTSLGVVRDVQFSGGTPLLVVQAARGEVLVPLAEEICRVVDVRAKRIEAVLPEGLLDLNL